MHTGKQWLFLQWQAEKESERSKTWDTIMLAFQLKTRRVHANTTDIQFEQHERKKNRMHGEKNALNTLSAISSNTQSGTEQ